MPKDQHVLDSGEHRVKPYPLPHPGVTPPQIAKQEAAAREAAAKKGYQEKYVSLAREAFKKKDAKLYHEVYNRNDFQSDAFTCSIKEAFGEKGGECARNYKTVAGLREHFQRTRHRWLLGEVEEHLRAKTLMTLEVNGYLLYAGRKNEVMPLPTHTTTDETNPQVAGAVHHADNTPYTTDSIGLLLKAAQLVDSQDRQRRSPSAGPSSMTRRSPSAGLSRTRRSPSAGPSRTRRSPSAGPSTTQRSPSASPSTKPEKKYVALAPEYRKLYALRGAREDLMKENSELHSQVYADDLASHQYNQTESRYLCPFHRMFGDKCKAKTYYNIQTFREHVSTSRQHKIRLNEIQADFRSRVYIAVEVNAYLLGHDRGEELREIPAGALPARSDENQSSSKVAKAPKKDRV